MASIGSWLSKIDSTYTPKDTSQTYNQIRQLGLDTVEWDSFSSNDPAEVASRAKKFIPTNNPCLFIWDPISDNPHFRKSFLFGVTDPAEVSEWVKNNVQDLDQYRFLLTTQITNPGAGFVGSVYSDGMGKVFGETLHHPGICNHQKLSQSSLPTSKNLDHFVAEGFSFEGGHLPHLGLGNAKELIATYSPHKGYFEFVCGLQKGKWGIYTVGYENSRLFDFPDDLHKSSFIEFRGGARLRT
jgi:hypothetical protein